MGQCAQVQKRVSRASNDTFRLYYINLCRYRTYIFYLLNILGSWYFEILRTEMDISVCTNFLIDQKWSYTLIGYTFGIVTARSWLVLCRLYNINCSLLFFNTYCYRIIGIPLGMIIRMIPAGIQNNPLLSIQSQCVRSHLK